ncbi:MAG: hypothetical protein EZS28_049789, partial [Streblomastix strix]
GLGNIHKFSKPSPSADKNYGQASSNGERKPNPLILTKILRLWQDGKKNITATDALEQYHSLFEKVEYSAQTITANKTFNISCSFVSSIDGMSTVTGSSFIKYRADDTVVLLGAGGTKPISEFVSAPMDLSNYCTKTQVYSRAETDNKYVKLERSVQQTIP